MNGIATTREKRKRGQQLAFFAVTDMVFTDRPLKETAEAVRAEYHVSGPDWFLYVQPEIYKLARQRRRELLSLNKTMKKAEAFLGVADGLDETRPLEAARVLRAHLVKVARVLHELEGYKTANFSSQMADAVMKVRARLSARKAFLERLFEGQEA